jgi:hypothetical protein
MKTTEAKKPKGKKKEKQASKNAPSPIFQAKLKELQDVVNNIFDKNLKAAKKPQPQVDKSKWAIWWLTSHQAEHQLGQNERGTLKLPPYVKPMLEEIANNELINMILVHSSLEVSDNDPVLRAIFDEHKIDHDDNVGVLMYRSDVPFIDQSHFSLGLFTDLDGQRYRSAIEGHPMHPYKNPNYLIWWVTPDEANRVLEAYDANIVAIPTYVEEWLSEETMASRFFDCFITVQPDFGIDESELNRLNIRPDNYSEDDMAPAGILIPFEDKMYVEGLAGVVTDMTGSIDLRTITRAFNMKRNLDDVKVIDLNEEDLVKVVDKVKERHSRFETTDEIMKRLADEKTDGSYVTLQDLVAERRRLQALYDAEDLADEIAMANAETHDGLRNYDDYLIWWLTDVEANAVLKASMDKHTTVPLYMLTELSGIAHDFCGGFIHVPRYLADAPYNVNCDDLDSLEVESPDQENMRDGILFPKGDLEMIHIILGIFTDVKGEQMDKPHHPVAVGRNTKKYVIWWLTDVEMRILNQGIMDGSVKLPGYLNEVMKEHTRDTQYPGIIIPNCVDLDWECLEEYTKPWATKRNLNGIVVPRGDMDCINKYCGSITDIATNEVSWDEFNATPYTADEIRSMFLTYVKDIVKYWVKQHPNDAKQAAEGAVFSTLSTLDGSSMELPGFLIIPNAQEEDNKFNADYGKRPYPIAPAELVNEAVDIGGSLHELFYQEQEDVIHCKNHITKKQWKDGLATQKWAYICEVLTKDTQFIRDRFKMEHPGIVLGNAWRDLCIICLKNGAYFIPEDYDTLADDYSFKWATDDEGVFENMINDLSGYVLRGHF